MIRLVCWSAGEQTVFALLEGEDLLSYVCDKHCAPEARLCAELFCRSQIFPSISSTQGKQPTSVRALCCILLKHLLATDSQNCLITNSDEGFRALKLQ